MRAGMGNLMGHPIGENESPPRDLPSIVTVGSSPTLAAIIVECNLTYRGTNGNKLWYTQRAGLLAVGNRSGCRFTRFYDVYPAVAGRLAIRRTNGTQSTELK